jgi:hypothetical protein
MSPPSARLPASPVAERRRERASPCSRIIDLNPGVTLGFVTQCRKNLKETAKNAEEYLDTLLRINFDFSALRRTRIDHRIRPVIANPHSRPHLRFEFPLTALDQLPIALFEWLAAHQKPSLHIIRFGQANGEAFICLFIGPHSDEDAVFLALISEHPSGERGEVIARAFER